MEFLVVFFMCVIAPVLVFLGIVLPPLLYVVRTRHLPNNTYDYFD